MSEALACEYTATELLVPATGPEGEKLWVPEAWPGTEPEEIKRIQIVWKRGRPRRQHPCSMDWPPFVIRAVWIGEPTLTTLDGNGDVRD